MMRYHLWLTLRLIRKQKLRTVTIFCGILFSVFLQITFCSFGYDFWMQVHGGVDKTAQFDSTQSILILLITVLLLLILSCSAILLHNLCSLTFAQRWKSLSRLLTLGADFHGMVTMTLMETLLLYITASPIGYLLARTIIDQIGVQASIPGWMLGQILAWIFLVSCICNARPLLAILRKPEFQPKKSRRSRHHKWGPKTRKRSPHFPSFMARNYRQANRGPYIRTTMTILAAILLYVPASYLINRNMDAQQAGLQAKYGIQYNCHPQDETELAAALDEYQRMSNLCRPGEAMVSVSFETTASVKTDGISNELRRSLKRAGWQESPDLSVDCTILFLEDPAYPFCLINRYTNRSNWAENGDPLFSETSLLAEGTSLTNVEVYTDFTENFEPDTSRAITPAAIADEIPEGIDFTGNLTLVLPMSQLEMICSGHTDYHRFHVQGKFIDSDENVFSRLENSLGEHPLGELTYTRKILREWYDSMHGIHQAMNAICLTLFFIAVLNIFSIMIFQYMERKRGLAILWSLGQSTKELLKIMILEHVSHFLAAFIPGIPLSGFLCYYIYRIFRRAWSVPFTLPLRQLLLITAAAFIVSSTAILINGYLMRRQDFLANIKDII